MTRARPRGPAVDGRARARCALATRSWAGSPPACCCFLFGGSRRVRRRGRRRAGPGDRADARRGSRRPRPARPRAGRRRGRPALYAPAGRGGPDAAAGRRHPGPRGRFARPAGARRAALGRAASRSSTRRRAAASGRSTTPRATPTSNARQRAARAHARRRLLRPAARERDRRFERRGLRDAPGLRDCRSASRASPVSAGFRALDPCSPRTRASCSRSTGPPTPSSLQRQAPRPRGIGAALRRALGAAPGLRGRRRHDAAQPCHAHRVPRLRGRPAASHRPADGATHGWPGARSRLPQRNPSGFRATPRSSVRARRAPPRPNPALRLHPRPCSTARPARSRACGTRSRR